MENPKNKSESKLEKLLNSSVFYQSVQCAHCLALKFHKTSDSELKTNQ